MSTYTQYWLRWIDRFLIALGMGALLLGVSMMDAGAQTSVPPAVAPTPRAMMTVLDPRGNEVMVFDSDGTLRFDYGGTISWSRYFVGDWVPPKGRTVWVLTWINGPDGRRPRILPPALRPRHSLARVATRPERLPAGEFPHLRAAGRTLKSVPAPRFAIASGARFCCRVGPHAYPCFLRIDPA